MRRFGVHLKISEVNALVRSSFPPGGLRGVSRPADLANEAGLIERGFLRRLIDALNI